MMVGVLTLLKTSGDTFYNEVQIIFSSFFRLSLHVMSI